MNFKLNLTTLLKQSFFLMILGILLSGCKGLPGADARKFPDDPKLRVKKNLAEGRGFRLNDSLKSPKGGVFEFASSNELWRASLDVIDFMPLTSVNYSGGIIITDWYSGKKKQNESIKITIRFLTNEIRSDALEIKIFTRKCKDSVINCEFIDSNRTIVSELRKEILKKAIIYKKENEEKKNKKN
ncbi:DUF3576 domain-containing protein [Candidatus Pelagibacter sp.]|nr:DUF3576 domain-containing protein [Candidatus Pelagibacter sp.]|tara:strand:+ start:222 stop:776 length:555 start_codon:yes stop_codon:yes gene_type:complete